ncbi:GL16324 [Drosophila persimilis]|uniref:GL16324 n=1 Tax=Drosophila persimilis TaxID=7234 RepID=B4HAE3_DROPE|nr:GL16324 [Drosophila persimilis]
MRIDRSTGHKSHLRTEADDDRTTGKNSGYCGYGYRYGYGESCDGYPFMPGESTSTNTSKIQNQSSS